MALSKQVEDERIEGPMTAYVYVLCLQSGALYIGATENLKQRIEDHLIGRACRTTSRDPMVALVYHELFETFSDARRREAQVKRWTRAKKEALITGDAVQLKQLSKRNR